MIATQQYHIGAYPVTPLLFYSSILAGVIILIWVFKIQKKRNIKHIKKYLLNKGYELQSLEYHPSGSASHANVDGTCYSVTYFNKEQKVEHKLCFCSLNAQLTWVDV